MNIVGVIELKNLSAAIFEEFKAVNGEVVIAFFRKVRAAYTAKSVIPMVLYSAGYHRSNEVIGEAEKLGNKTTLSTNLQSKLESDRTIMEGYE